MAQSFDNLNAAFGCCLIIFIASLTGQVGFQIVAVRSIWAFARDGALPFSDFFSKIDERSIMPARANILIGKIPPN
jgi:choline transport protein